MNRWVRRYVLRHLDGRSIDVADRGDYGFAMGDVGRDERAEMAAVGALLAATAREETPPPAKHGDPAVLHSTIVVGSMQITTWWRWTGRTEWTMGEGSDQWIVIE